MFCRVPLERIFDNPFQTRTVYTEIEELAQSIVKMRGARPETSGLMQTPSARLVMPNGKGWQILNPDEYGGVESALGDEPGAVVQLAFGHRRLRAFHGLAGEALSQGEREEEYATFPVEIVPLTDQQMADLAWEENEKRKDLTAIEEALALQLAIDLFGYTQSQIGERWGLSQSAVANKLRLLQLPREAQEAIRRGELTEKHGRALLAAYQKSPAIYEAAARDIIPSEVDRAAAERAREMVGQTNQNWYEARGPRDPDITKLECEACGQRVFEANLFYQPYITVNYPRQMRLCIPCYRAAVGWAVPSTAEAEAIVRRAVNQNSSRLAGVEWPLEQVFEAPVSEGISRNLPACEGCPARETRDKEEWCLDKTCFELKGKLWQEAQFAAVRARLETDWGRSVKIVEGWNGQNLSKNGIDPELVKNGVCVPGKCKRLRLKYRNGYVSPDDLRPYDDLPFVWNCDNSNAHSACQRRYLASQQAENEKTAERLRAEMGEQRKREAKALVESARALVLAKMQEGQVEVWKQIAGKTAGYSVIEKCTTIEQCQEWVAYSLLDYQFRELGWRDWKGEDALNGFKRSVKEGMKKLGLELPADISQEMMGLEQAE